MTKLIEEDWVRESEFTACRMENLKLRGIIDMLRGILDGRGGEEEHLVAAIDNALEDL